MPQQENDWARAIAEQVRSANKGVEIKTMKSDAEFDRGHRALVEHFRDNQPQTVVPAVELSTAQWRAIVEIILDLAELVDDTCPNEVRTALIEGRVLAESAQKAWGLMHSLELDTWYARNEQVLEMARQKRKEANR